MNDAFLNIYFHNQIYYYIFLNLIVFYYSIIEILIKIKLVN